MKFLRKYEQKQRQKHLLIKKNCCLKLSSNLKKIEVRKMTPATTTSNKKNLLSQRLTPLGV